MVCISLILSGEGDSSANVFNLLDYLQEENDTNSHQNAVAMPASRVSPATLCRQLAMFTSEQELPKTGNPLGWWSQNENRYYVLKDLAKKYLAVPATSAPSERAFSLAGNICNRRRASLSPQHLDALVFLNANFDLAVE